MSVATTMTTPMTGGTTTSANRSSASSSTHPPCDRCKSLTCLGPAHTHNAPHQAHPHRTCLPADGSSAGHVSTLLLTTPTRECNANAPIQRQGSGLPVETHSVSITTNETEPPTQPTQHSSRAASLRLRSKPVPATDNTYSDGCGGEVGQEPANPIIVTTDSWKRANSLNQTPAARESQPSSDSCGAALRRSKASPQGAFATEINEAYYSEENICDLAEAPTTTTNIKSVLTQLTICRNDPFTLIGSDIEREGRLRSKLVVCKNVSSISVPPSNESYSSSEQLHGNLHIVHNVSNVCIESETVVDDSSESISPPPEERMERKRVPLSHRRGTSATVAGNNGIGTTTTTGTRLPPANGKPAKVLAKSSLYTNLMYQWTHTEPPTPTPVTPGRLEPHVVWPHASATTVGPAKSANQQPASTNTENGSNHMDTSHDPSDDRKESDFQQLRRRIASCETINQLKRILQEIFFSDSNLPPTAADIMKHQSFSDNAMHHRG
uniref:Uncharacterized protein n=1 Tax=Anopheles melas TaxID=34690 RepID=A0A182UG90_9DIPT